MRALCDSRLGSQQGCDHRAASCELRGRRAVEVHVHESAGDGQGSEGASSIMSLQVTQHSLHGLLPQIQLHHCLRNGHHTKGSAHGHGGACSTCLVGLLLQLLQRRKHALAQLPHSLQLSSALVRQRPQLQVVRPVQHQHSACRLAVTAGAADLLHIVLQAVGQRQVHHSSHLSLVNAHAKSNGSYHHARTARAKCCLHAEALVHVLPGVVGGGVDACLLEAICNLISLCLEGHVCDDRLHLRQGAGAQGCQQPGAGAARMRAVVHVDDLQPDVLPERQLTDDGGGGKAQHLADGCLRVPCGCCREPQHGMRPQHSAQDVAQAEVGGAERMAPLAHAVSLIHTHQGYALQFAQGAQHAGVQKLLRCHIEQLDCPARCVFQHLLSLQPRLPSPQHCARDCGRQPVQLVAHEGQQGAHYQRHTR
mmetsp:Transcript_30729/g.80005  ORF Transcript_30729/g.80005 Transcript_30729/m.80005 type:complete len:422 (+) Transcript_30729:1281-2546(+)